MIVGKGYAKTDTEVSMKMRGELFEVTPPIRPAPTLDLPFSSRLSALVFTLTLQWAVKHLPSLKRVWNAEGSLSALNAGCCAQAVWGAQFVDSGGSYASEFLTPSITK